MEGIRAAGRRPLAADAMRRRPRVEEAIDYGILGDDFDPPADRCDMLLNSEAQLILEADAATRRQHNRLIDKYQAASMEYLSTIRGVTPTREAIHEIRQVIDTAQTEFYQHELVALSNMVCSDEYRLEMAKTLVPSLHSTEEREVDDGELLQVLDVIVANSNVVGNTGAGPSGV